VVDAVPSLINVAAIIRPPVHPLERSAEFMAE
jgi:hypothetical protein